MPRWRRPGKTGAGKSGAARPVRQDLRGKTGGVGATEHDRCGKTGAARPARQDWSSKAGVTGSVRRHRRRKNSETDRGGKTGAARLARQDRFTRPACRPGWGDRARPLRHNRRDSTSATESAAGPARPDRQRVEGARRGGAHPRCDGNSGPLAVEHGGGGRGARRSGGQRQPASAGGVRFPAVRRPPSARRAGCPQCCPESRLPAPGPRCRAGARCRSGADLTGGARPAPAPGRHSRVAASAAPRMAGKTKAPRRGYRRRGPVFRARPSGGEADVSGSLWTRSSGAIALIAVPLIRF